jgi:metal-sulfur cluster biosynthetic enzyme
VEAAAPFRYDGDAARRGPIIAALERVIDPELAVDIVNLGLVQDVASTADETRVRLTLTSAACPMGELIVLEVEQELAAVLGPGHRVEVSLCWTPAWAPERMSARARSLLGWE